MKEENPVSTVFNIFSDFFGEENVDLQEDNSSEPFIIVHFPKVTVTNEHDRSVDITHLWVKVQLSGNGTINGTFRMMRSEYTEEQFLSGYGHSHINSISSSNFKEWALPCLGSGPIRNTILSLTSQFSVEMWNLFCFELSKYVTVESLTGTPYKYLEQIGVGHEHVPVVINIPLRYIDTYISPGTHLFIDPFIRFVIKKRPFGFNFVDGSYGIAMSDRDIFITLSNLFIEYYNSLPVIQRPSKLQLFRDGILRKGKRQRNLLMYILDSSNDTAEAQNLIGEELFKFKDKMITLNITNFQNKEEDPNMSLFLTEEIVRFIIDRILRVINNKYGK